MPVSELLCCHLGMAGVTEVAGVLVRVWSALGQGDNVIHYGGEGDREGWAELA